MWVCNSCSSTDTVDHPKTGHIECLQCGNVDPIEEVEWIDEEDIRGYPV